jgi:hypothetical protein
MGLISIGAVVLCPAGTLHVPTVPVLPRALSVFSSLVMYSVYGLDDRSSIPDRDRIFPLSRCVQTDSGADPASCTMGTGSPFPGGKARPVRDADHSPSNAEVKNSRSYTSLSPQAPPWRVSGSLCLLPQVRVSARLALEGTHMRSGHGPCVLYLKAMLQIAVVTADFV